MTVPKVSEEHSRARRQQILDAAARCFTRTGFHRATVADIVAESGLSAGLLYRYFADKDAIVVAIATQWHDAQSASLHLPGPGDDQRPWLTPEAAAETASPRAAGEVAGAPGPVPTVAGPDGGTAVGAGRARLAAITAGYLDMLRSLGEPAERERVRLGVQVWAEALRAPAIHTVARQGVDEPRAAITALVRAARERGELPATLPADGTARVLIAIYQGLALQTAWDEDLDHAAAADAVAALLSALAAPAAAAVDGAP
ncbi:TetR/AcrR family transcriptional regulator [Pseudofrankia asymbiotica]|uniref:HTH tetR-type domain-containing protein n=1 Tax=Pseudofrankia asymbiotica TaxID=1834516 RepID=A0A1V2IHZ4_9ACTN|nr:TetR/AcrR family transcriptional regulator [Pseudofrankia asymbiotica]ONH32803.1 hypothetical protein BL253_03455 [Pseudofrankia asymbiotica]